MVKFMSTRTELKDKPRLSKLHPDDGSQDGLLEKQTVVHMQQQRWDKRQLVGIGIGFLILIAVGGALLGLYMSGRPHFRDDEGRPEMREMDYHRDDGRNRPGDGRNRPGDEQGDHGGEHRGQRGEADGQRGPKDRGESKSPGGQNFKDIHRPSY